MNYSVGGWRLLSGSAHGFDETTVRETAVREVDPQGVADRTRSQTASGRTVHGGAAAGLSRETIGAVLNLRLIEVCEYPIHCRNILHQKVRVVTKLKAEATASGNYFLTARNDYVRLRLLWISGVATCW